MIPATFSQALLRGLRSRCPRCGEGSLFRKWLKPRERSPVCTMDLTPQRADDFPAYIAMIVTGHLMAPLIIALSVDYDLGPLAMFAILVPLAIAMMIGMLQPAKGGVIATQWWFGMHGFVKERLPETPVQDAPGDERPQ
ncbi:DUF983 domain-containing protein [Novosphingobium guangzhouense]|uniref:DUF983 domain-containing protein n=1 Tax=Novosphingobium guangzhouense TaxID=1850347 RepID=A0A2K2G4L8_9SPHN|nr:DUF983 domain-containing protein [Novosphingobium guangzhouense]PNU05974.1 hypothetical protein A8V01_14000 [Novosphingobium guangzhouense]